VPNRETKEAQETKQQRLITGKLFKKSFPLAFQKRFSIATPAELQIIFVFKNSGKGI
jgi:hypothetical protein